MGRDRLCDGCGFSEFQCAVFEVGGGGLIPTALTRITRIYNVDNRRIKQKTWEEQPLRVRCSCSSPQVFAVSGSYPAVISVIRVNALALFPICVVLAEESAQFSRRAPLAA